MDKGRELADKELEKLERRLAREYKTAQKEMKAKYSKYTADFKEKDKAKRALLTAGKLDPQEYKEWYEGQTLRSAWFKNMVDKLAKDQTQINQRAAAVINGAIPNAYAEGFNFGTYSVEKAIKMNTGFTLYNKRTVERLAKDNPRLLPKAKVDVPKDVAWNKRKMNSAITQGILQGESIDKIAGRLMRVTDMNANAAIRNARTMVGSAESEARLDSFMRAAEMGIKQKKTWIATLDDRVRDSHAELDGETVPLEEPFSNGLMYPRDPSGEPAEVYNCRCEIITQIEGFERDVTDLNLRPAEISSYDEWKREHTGKGADFAASIAAIVAAKGVTEESIKECGEIFVNEMDKEYKTLANEVNTAQAEVDKIMAPFKPYEAEFKQLWDATFESPAFGSLGLTWEEGKARYDELQNIKLSIKRSEEYKKAKEKLRIARERARDEKVVADMLAKKLSQIRPVGSDGIDIVEHLSKSRSPMRKHVEFAYARYPRSWVEKSVDFGKLGVKKENRGYYSRYERMIALSGDGDRAARSCAFHELGHRFEDSVAGIRESEKTFYNRRTAGEPLQWLGSGYRRDEKARFDKFLDAYMGKDYSGTYYELVSMGFQYAYTDPLKLAKDPDMQKWIYGLLAIG